jgi:hypothetical protein
VLSEGVDENNIFRYPLVWQHTGNGEWRRRRKLSNQGVPGADHR